MKKKIILLILLILLILFFFIFFNIFYKKIKYNDTENNVANIKNNVGNIKNNVGNIKNNVGNIKNNVNNSEDICSNFLKKPVLELSKDSKFFSIFQNYIGIYNMVINDEKPDDNFDNEFISIGAFAKKDCNLIKNDQYTYDLCQIYVSGDLSKLDTFVFDKGDTKDRIMLSFKSLYEGRILPGKTESDNKYLKRLNLILNWNNFKKDINIDLLSDPGYTRYDYFIYSKENGKDKFKMKLDKEFLNQCKKIINEN